MQPAGGVTRRHSLDGLAAGAIDDGQISGLAGVLLIEFTHTQGFRQQAGLVSGGLIGQVEANEQDIAALEFRLHRLESWIQDFATTAPVGIHQVGDLVRRGGRARARPADLLIVSTAAANGLPLHTRSPVDFSPLKRILKIVKIQRNELDGAPHAHSIVFGTHEHLKTRDIVSPRHCDRRSPCDRLPGAGSDAGAQCGVRGEHPVIVMPMAVRWWDQRGDPVEQFERGEGE